MQNNLHIVQERIAEAAIRSGRPAGDIHLVAVSKTFPAEDILDLHREGQVDFGENRVQELTDKMDQLAPHPLRWHLIGHLQRNKVREVIARIHLFHALDSLRLAREIQKRMKEQAPREGDGPEGFGSAPATLDCLVQVNVSGEASKYGIDPGDLEPFLEALPEMDRLRPCGLMTLAHPAEDPEEVRGEFALLRRLRDENAHQLGPGFLSMGMSGDFEVAIEEGATHVRIGSALFGDRG